MATKKDVKKPAKGKAAAKAKPKAKAPAKSKAPEKNLGGRPTKYNDDLHPRLIKALMEQGKTIPEACEEMGISTSTYWLWSQEHDKFSIAIKDAKDKADANVEASLYRLAKGYEHEVEKPMIVGDGMGEGHVEIVKYTERLAPSTTAIIFWLKNRKPKEWRDKQEIGLTDKDGNDRSFSINFVKPEA